MLGQQRSVTVLLFRENIHFMGELKHPHCSCQHAVNTGTPKRICLQYVYDNLHRNVVIIIKNMHDTSTFSSVFPLPRKYFQQQLWELLVFQCVFVLFCGTVFFISCSSGVSLKQVPVWGLVPVLPDSYTHSEACWHNSIA